MRRLAPAFCLCLLTGVLSAAAQTLTGWANHQEVKLNTTASGADIKTALAHYPVPVQLNADNFDFTKAKDDGSDIRFTKADGSALPYEMELWDKDAKLAAFWVKFDVTQSSASQSFYMHWGNPGAASQSDSKAVFSLDDGWMGVWHIGEAANNESHGYKDATPNEAHLTGVRFKTAPRKQGRVGYGTNMIFADSNWLHIEELAKNNLFHLAKNVTFECWAVPNAFNGTGWQTVMSKGDQSWRFQQSEKSKQMEICSDGEAPVCIFSKDLTFGKWYHFCGVQEQPAVRMYINGALVAQGNAAKPHVSYGDWDVGIGNNSQTKKAKRYWDGMMDEPRVSKLSKTADWIKLDYESMREGSTFITFGPVASTFVKRTLPGYLAPGHASIAVYDLAGRRVEDIQAPARILFRGLKL